MAKLGLEARMTIHELVRRGVSGRQIARTLEVTEGTVRYHCRRRAAGAEDGRGKQAFLATGWHDQIAEWPAAPVYSPRPRLFDSDSPATRKPGYQPNLTPPWKLRASSRLGIGRKKSPAEKWRAIARCPPGQGSPVGRDGARPARCTAGRCPVSV